MLSAWQSWTPTWTNFTVGNGTVDAKYIQIGKTVHARLRAVMGSTSSMGSDPVFTLPVTPHTAYVQPETVGHGFLLDSGTSLYHVLVTFDGSYRGLMYAVVTSGAYGTYGSITASVPFVWGTNDGFGLNLTYEAA